MRQKCFQPAWEAGRRLDVDDDEDDVAKFDMEKNDLIQ